MLYNTGDRDTHSPQTFYIERFKSLLPSITPSLLLPLQ